MNEGIFIYLQTSSTWISSKFADDDKELMMTNLGSDVLCHIFFDVSFVF